VLQRLVPMAQRSEGVGEGSDLRGRALWCWAARFLCLCCLGAAVGCELETLPIRKQSASSERADAAVVSHEIVDADVAHADAGSSDLGHEDAGVDRGGRGGDQAGREARQCEQSNECVSTGGVCQGVTCVSGRCVNGVHPVGTVCGDGGVCDQAGQCQDCRPGKTECVGTERQRTCGAAGQWLAAARCSALCLAGVCVECEPGAVECKNDQRRECASDGRFGPKTRCEFGCDTGEACHACQPGSSECVDGNGRARTCNVQGQWDSAVACEHGCAAGQCVECDEGALRCTGDGAQRCGKDRRWGAITACPAGCAGDRCAECRDGQRDCSSRTDIRVCRGQAWGMPQGCRPHAHCDADAQDGNWCPCDDGYDDPHPNPGVCGERGRR